MSGKDELYRSVIHSLLLGEIDIMEAAKRCELSSRQVHRLKRKALDEGIISLQHGNKGRKPKHAIDPELEERIASLYRDFYSDLNFTHFSDVIARDYSIQVSRSTIYRVLSQAGFSTLGKTRRTRKKEEDSE